VDHVSLTILMILFVPTIIGLMRLHHNVLPIFIVNLFLGWTILGWVLVLAWSLSYIPKKRAFR